MDTVELAIDGFPLEPSDPDVRLQRELSTWLEIEKPNRVPVALQLGPPEDRSRWLRPALRRFAWVRAHSELIAPGRRLDFRIAHLISLLVNRMSLDKPEPGGDTEQTFVDLASQAAAIEASGAGSMFQADTGRLLIQLVRSGIGPATRARIHAMLRELPSDGRFGSMHELAWALFVDLKDELKGDESAPEDGEPCWSAAVRRELREMKPALRNPWIAWLKLAPVRLASPAGDVKWQQRVRKAVEKIGVEAWESRASEWTAKAHGSDPKNTGRAGQILLRHIEEVRKVLESEPKPAPDSTELIRLLLQGSYAGFEQTAEYTKRHGYQPEIVEAVRQYHATLHGSVTDQARRQHVGWWLWLEDATPIRTEECWSGIVRADLRTFEGARKKAWMDLISNMTFAVTAKPPAKWIKAAEAAMAAVGPEDFANHVRRWLAPMAGENPLRLSTPGRDALRCLIWDCSFCPPDEELDQALASIAAAKWKNKESRDRMLKITGPLEEVLKARNPALARTLPSSRPEVQAKPAAQAPDFLAIMDKALSRALNSTPLGDRIEIRPDYIFVRGERDEYRIGLDGFITRRNGSAVRVNMDALPPYITQLVQPAIDAIDLQQGMFQPNRMRLISLATILAHDAQWESAIE